MELGIHSYLTVIRDRLLLARELLAPTGSIFVQISDENIHHVRESSWTRYSDQRTSIAIVASRRLAGVEHGRPANVTDYLLWYAKDKESPSNIGKLYLKNRLVSEIDRTGTYDCD